MIQSKRKTEFIWVGDPPKCAVLKGVHIYDQDIMQTELSDPVKGHLWDLERNKCLVHDVCDCHLLGEVEIKITLFNFKIDKLRDQVKQVEEFLEKLRSER